MVEQHVSPRRTQQRMDRLGITQATVCEFADIQPPAFSRWLAGERGLSLDAQGSVIRAMKFFEQLAEGSDTPIDFNNTPAIQKHWRKFLDLQTVELIRTNSEMAEESQERQ